MLRIIKTLTSSSFFRRIEKKMKPFRLMHLYRHLATNAVCPHCGTPVFPEAVRVDASLDESAFLTIYCAGCNTYVNAHVYVNLADVSDSNENKHEEISSEELEFAHVILQNHAGNISDLFSKSI